MTSKVLVAYATKNGSTAEIAATIADILREEGLSAEARPVEEITDPSAYDAVVLGGALYNHRWHRQAARFARRHHRFLSTVPVWLFSSGPLDPSAAQHVIPPVGAAARALVRLDARGHITFGGCLLEGAQGRVARLILRRGGGGDYRNREQIRLWTRRVARELTAAELAGRASGQPEAPKTASRLRESRQQGLSVQTTPPHTVGEVMTHTVVAVRRDAGFKEIIKTLERWHVSAMPVVEGENKVVGIVSETDLLPKEEIRRTDPDRSARMHRASADVAKSNAVTAGELMSSPAVTVQADAALADAARTLLHLKIKRLPVVDAHGHLEGIVSRSDVLRVFLRPDEEIADEVRRTVIADVLPDPLKPINVEVTDGVVKITGRIKDTALVPVVRRLARSVEGVVDVECNLAGTPHTPQG